ncbi:sugar phosphate nucleotidyltransferase [Paenibacillus chartarius]|uniref:Sugar phosphate nucleotidyltransferase n=1 Tax=Paenibacillus chartarius TaxID=747481 RepID=A0ABV6DLN3_9BACL
MKLILLSGGSGKRLWPLSNEARSKQFLKMLKNPNQQLESMVQRVWRQLEDSGLAEHAYIATGTGQADIIHSQLGEHVPVIIEPERRDTFPAIALAASYLYSIAGAGLNEVICILPVDPYVDAGFFNKIQELEDVCRDTNADIALVGVKPTEASEKFGYIVPSLLHKTEAGTDYAKVARFQEKPKQEKARALIELGALWNCGVFACKLDYIIQILIDKGLPIQYEELLKNYDKLPKISFDYEVVEKAERIVVLPFDGTWKDLGTWDALTEEIETSIIGNGIVSEDSVNVHLVNELEIPVTVLGCRDLIIATSPDGILVSDKTSSPKVKDVLKHMEQRPMYEERRWGWYRVLDYIKRDGREILTKRIGIHAGKNLSYQMHFKRSEAWTVISGEGQFILNDKLFHIQAGDVLQIPIRARHSILAITDLEIIEVQTGSQLVEEDIVRLELDWNIISSYAIR